MEVYSLADYLSEELEARGWTTSDLAFRMPGDYVRNKLKADLFLAVQSDGLLLDDGTCAAFADALGVSPELLRNLDTLWREHSDIRVPFTPPESVFGDDIRWSFGRDSLH